MNDLITESEARFIASEWHGGQFQPLYALSSTGTVVPGAAAEVRSCLRAIDGGHGDENERERLESLLAFCEANEPEDEG